MKDLREEKITHQISELSSDIKRIAFAYSACYRMAPNYIHFTNKEGWGNAECFIKCLGYIDGFLRRHHHDELTKESLLSELYHSIPDSEEFPSQHAQYARCAATSVYYTLEAIDNLKVDRLRWVFLNAFETITVYLMDKYDKVVIEDENEEEMDFFMLREVRKQRQDFDLLKANTAVTDDLIEQLLDFNQGKSIIDM